MKPFLLQAVCKDYVWGGNRLRDYGKQSQADRIAESWELSTHPDGESVIASGQYKGMPLSAFLKEHPEAAAAPGYQPFDPFPVIVKLIDAHEDLSVQVHPDKTELWYIIDAEPGASILYGFEKEITPEEVQTAIREGTLLSRMKRIPVSPGDVFLIPSGTLHSIGKGILLAEVQQNSNITYRVYDHDRGRELHIAQALQHMQFSPTVNTPARKASALYNSPSTFVRVLGGCRAFSVMETQLNGHKDASPGSCYEHILVLDGRGSMSTDDGTVMLEKGNSIFVPAGTEYMLWGECTLLGTVTVPFRN